MILASGMILDALFGEPKVLWDRLPHPAVLMGRLIGWIDEHFNVGPFRRAKGAFAIGLLLGAAGLLGAFLSEISALLEILVLAVLLAQRSLVEHVQQVAEALRLGLGDARQAVAKIVGREVEPLDQTGIARAAIESAAENLSDGVVAPIFWYIVAGLPGVLAYKMLNTADSMIGYRTPQYEDFGWAAARLDDVANWVPARITAAALWILCGARKPWRSIQAEARLHRSPNAGWPEAAIAHSLDFALSGPRVYHGRRTEDPYINSTGRKDLGPEQIEQTIRALWKVWWFCLGAAVFIA